MRVKVGGAASPSKRGPVASVSAKPGRAMNKKPVGGDKKGIHPMTKKTGNVKMNRNLKGIDKRKGSKGVANKGAKSLEGKWF